jgi:hypothetical protein
MPLADRTIAGSTVGEGFAVVVAVVGVALADGVADPTDVVGNGTAGKGELGARLAQPETALTRKATATSWGPVRRLMSGLLV